MNKLMSRYKGLILSCVSVMMIVVCVCSFSFESHASNNGLEFFVNYAEPSTSDTQGYITLLLQDTSSGEYAVETYFWYCVANVNSIESPSYMTLSVSSSGAVFNPGGSSNASGAYYSLSCFDSTGALSFRVASSTSSYNLNLSKYGWNVIGCKYSGNVGDVSFSGLNQTQLFTVYFAEDGSSVLLMDIISLLTSSNSIDSSILTAVQSILNSVDGVENQLSSVISYLSSVSSKLTSIQSQLSTLITCADELLAEQQESNSWLEKIWNSIQEFITPSEEDSVEGEELENETTEKTDKLDELNEQNKTDKTDIDGASNSVDENVDLESIGTVNNIFVYITENEYILQMLLMVFSVALVAYVLFGKK